MFSAIATAVLLLATDPASPNPADAAASPLQQTAAISHDYAAAQAAARAGRPVGILVCASWCAPCKLTQQLITSELSAGRLRQIFWVHVDSEQQPEIARRWVKGHLVPQVVLYYRTPHGFRLRRSIGKPSVATLRLFEQVAREHQPSPTTP